jgi:hypothetical protein
VGGGSRENSIKVRFCVLSRAAGKGLGGGGVRVSNEIVLLSIPGDLTDWQSAECTRSQKTAPAAHAGRGIHRDRCYFALTGAKAELIAAGGVCEAEGAFVLR